MSPVADQPPIRLLILDDEPIVCKRLKPTFQKLGYDVETFTDSASALARLRQQPFDIVITDLKMEGADGMQVLAGVKEVSPATRVIVITGFATMETARESYRKGAFDFIAKPFKLGDLVECVQRVEKTLQTDRRTPPERQP
ncbi:MAG: response regulator [Desulfoprunum sp.]|jgi:DNA-binding NtrC family response regulator|uniref:response regulator n=1 Tax=Desulfoprunum sp. TaxID=2020866 RepID=UPI00052D024C|nr:histidine kinase [Desulfobulbus sp. Tol-SR]